MSIFRFIGFFGINAGVHVKNRLIPPDKFIVKAKFFPAGNTFLHRFR